MGGTFNPIHLGHLFIAETAFEELKLNKIIFIPTGDPPHKKNEDVIDGHHRLEMTKIAINSNKNFVVSNIEIKRKGYSYTVETIDELFNVYGRDIELYFITGTDTFMELETWKNYKELFHRVTIVVVTRLGFNDIILNKRIEHYKKIHGANIIKLTAPILEISSTNIRDRIKNKKSIKYLLPEKVEEYIYKNQLYT
ncbi:MAG: nicotinate-nucleotide adenylyltransferase [Clostridiales bacterium]|nr:nicotinate-nucleotide adenylyltransferase [Clostridiales bacterium]